MHFGGASYRCRKEDNLFCPATQHTPINVQIDDEIEDGRRVHVRRRSHRYGSRNIIPCEMMRELTGEAGASWRVMVLGGL